MLEAFFYLWWAKKTALSMKYSHGWLLLKMPLEGIFSNDQPCQRFMERTGFLAHQRYKKAYNTMCFRFLMENSIVKIFGSKYIKIGGA